MVSYSNLQDLHSAGHRSLVIEKCDFFLSLLGLPCSNDNRVVMKDLVSNFLTSCDYEKGNLFCLLFIARIAHDFVS